MTHHWWEIVIQITMYMPRLQDVQVIPTLLWMKYNCAAQLDFKKFKRIDIPYFFNLYPRVQFYLVTFYAHFYLVKCGYNSRFGYYSRAGTNWKITVYIKFTAVCLPTCNVEKYCFAIKKEFLSTHEIRKSFHLF